MKQRILSTLCLIGAIVDFWLAPISNAELNNLETITEDRNVQILEKKTGNGAISLYAHLTNCSEATITLIMTLTNMSASCKLPLIVDTMGRSSFELVTIRAIDEKHAWNYRYQHYWKPGRRGEIATTYFVYSLPYTNGTFTVIQADYGTFSHQQGSGDEHAIDWAMPAGTPICAAREGTVAAIRQDSNVSGEDPRYKHAFNYVIIMHDDGTFAEYCHLKRNGVMVSLGQKVKRRECLGVSGNTGYSSRPHLHFSVFQTVDGQTRRTIPIKFKTQAGKIETLKEDQKY
ncbi:MAG: M23 family metallopeptidase [Kiritimatiellae bacterium]|nr:M23 family metallopeptidase [Kiritimatiellia bacterium]MDD5523412.1 M23 family metallopeptidase [Kiritimatiellia bacterium]